MANTPIFYQNSPVSGTQYWSPMWCGVVANGENLTVTIKAYTGPNGTGSLIAVSSLTAILWDQTANASAGSFTNSGVNTEQTIDASVNGHWFKCSAQYTGSGVGSLSIQMNYGSSTAFVPTTPSFSPSIGGPGTSVTITGTRFTDATIVQFNGVNVSSFTINSDTQISTTVPNGATAGVVTVGNPAGSTNSSGNFQPGQLYYGDPDGDGSTISPVAVWYGDPSGSGTPHKAVGVWVPVGSPPTGVKRVW